MLEVIGAAPGTHSDIDWHQTWRGSPEYKGVKEHLKELEDLKNKKVNNAQGDPNDKAAKRPFAASYVEQYKVVTRRIFQQYWRTPSYLWAKVFLVTAAGLFIGFSFFQSPLSQQGLQNQLFSIFMVSGDICASASDTDLCLFPGLHHLLSAHTADYAEFCGPAVSVRSARATIESILVDWLHLCERHS